MAIPELYRYGREGCYFGMRMFSWYMLDAVLQVSTCTSREQYKSPTSLQSAIIFFLITYSYALTTARSDGYQIAMYEYSATMVLATVLAVNLFNGLNTTAWTVWVWFSILLGIVLCWVFTVSESTARRFGF
jgi:phospholipid-translocating ATPase